MSYDRIWVQNSEHPRGWLERRAAEKRNLGNEFEGHFNRLYAQGHFVVLVAGKNHCFDELFLFEDASGAHQFYESGFQKWESFIGDDDEGCGFQEASLYRGGQRVATKSCEPTKRAGTDHGDESEAQFERAAEFMEHDQMTGEENIQ
jgi:hypothetical protein